MPPATVDRSVIPPTDELPHEPERIALRSSLPNLPKQPAFESLPGFPAYDSQVELPRNSFDDFAAKLDSVKKVAEKAKVELPKKRISDPEPQAEPENLDMAYFPTRAMVPEFIALILVSAGWIVGVMPLLPAWWQSWEVLASVPGGYACIVFVQWLFRTMGGRYRLTKTHIHRVTAGPVADPDPLDLTTIASVKVNALLIETCLGVGCIHLTFERDVHPEVVLGPVSWPRRRAMRIEEAMELAREGSVVGTRMPVRDKLAA